MTLKHNMLYILTGLTILGSFIFSLWVLAFHEIPQGNRELFIGVIGLVDGAFIGGLVATFFGSSKKDHEGGQSITTSIESIVKGPQDKSKEEIQ